MISIIIPAYNEEKNVGFVIDDILNFFKDVGLPFEVIVINDGSEDKTEEVLDGYKQKTNITVISHKKNSGYGSALRSGFSVAKGDLVFFTDSDRQFDVRDMSLFLKKIKQADFVIGYRNIRKDPYRRILFAEIFGFASRIFFGVKARDIDCAFKLFNSYVIKDMNLISEGALINLEILAKANKRGYKFTELPVSHFKRAHGKQTGGSFKVVFKATINFFLLWRNVNSL